MYFQRCVDRWMLPVFWLLCVALICGLAQGAGGIAGPASAGFNGLLLRGYNAYPTPDDSEGPGDPRASDGGGGRVVGQGFMASPPDGGQGGQPIPPGPLFMRLRMRRAR